MTTTMLNYHALVSEAADAYDYFSEDELEAFADEQRAKLEQVKGD